MPYNAYKLDYHGASKSDKSPCIFSPRATLIPRQFSLGTWPSDQKPGQTVHTHAGQNTQHVRLLMQPGGIFISRRLS